MRAKQSNSLTFILQDSNGSGFLKMTGIKGSKITACHIGSDKTEFVKEKKINLSL
jgi:hypothetical protein